MTAAVTRRSSRRVASPSGASNALTITAVRWAALTRTAEGGLATTEHESGEQWDRPNGWAPLQWMAVEGLRRYGCEQAAQEIRSRWLRTVQSVYAREHKLVEKYALRSGRVPTGGGGGEYPLQDGFGWTNGVVRRWV